MLLDKRFLSSFNVDPDSMLLSCVDNDLVPITIVLGVLSFRVSIINPINSSCSLAAKYYVSQDFGDES